jgi:hypothetical protein
MTEPELPNWREPNVHMPNGPETSTLGTAPTALYVALRWARPGTNDTTDWYPALMMGEVEILRLPADEKWQLGRDQTHGPDDWAHELALALRDRLAATNRNDGPRTENAPEPETTNGNGEGTTAPPMRMCNEKDRLNTKMLVVGKPGHAHRCERPLGHDGSHRCACFAAWLREGAERPREPNTQRRQASNPQRKPSDQELAHRAMVPLVKELVEAHTEGDGTRETEALMLLGNMVADEEAN